MLSLTAKCAVDERGKLREPVSQVADVNMMMIVDEKYSSSVNLTVIGSFQNGLAKSLNLDQPLLLRSQKGLRVSQSTAEPGPGQRQSDPEETSNSKAVSQITNVAKVREGVRLASTRLRLEIKERREPFRPLSANGQFSHYYVEPLWEWWCKNDRLLLSQSLSKVDIQEGNGGTRSVLNGASHNYAGFYRSTPESEELQRLSLDRLPAADSTAIPCLESALHTAVAQFFNMDFSFTTSTGYGSNLLALPAILDENWLVILDEKSHSSMYTGSYLALSGCMRKFSHNNMSHLEAILQQQGGKFKNVLVAIEGFYSMDGDVPPLDQLHRLKQQYQFSLYCDEAHSFMSIGKTGRGCLECWNDEHPELQLSWDLIDVRTATLSKAVGGVGGFVCGNKKFKEAIRRRAKILSDRDNTSLTTSTMVQTLYLLGQPIHLARNLHHLRNMSQFCRKELKRFGIHVYGNASTPVLPVHTGRPSWAAKMSYVLRQLGLLATPVSAPAVGFWESRVRICLSAEHNDDEVNELLNCIIEAAQSIGITRKVDLPRIFFKHDDLDITKDESEDLETRESFKRIQDLILQDVANLQGRAWPSQFIFNLNCCTAVLDSGHIARKRYGLGSGGSRWVVGTFPSHLEVENLVTQAMQTEASMTFTDAEIGLSTTIAAVCRDPIGYSKHHLLVPKMAQAAVLEGIRMAPKRGAPNVIEYANVDELFFLLTGLYNRKVYITLYVDTVVNGVSADLNDIILRLTRCKGPRWGVTVLLNDFDGLGRHGPHRLGVAATLDVHKISKILDVQILVCGSFYRAFGLPGGYLTGGKVLIQELRFTIRGYMFATSPQPFFMEMIKTALQMRLSLKKAATNADSLLHPV